MCLMIYVGGCIVSPLQAHRLVLSLYKFVRANGLKNRDLPPAPRRDNFRPRYGLLRNLLGLYRRPDRQIISRLVNNCFRLP